jgi:hypothetical protein
MEKDIKEGKPIIIANPMFDIVFKELMNDMRIVTFFLSTILGRQVTEVYALPRELVPKKEKTKDETAEENKSVPYSTSVPYSAFRVNFMASIQIENGEYRKILIEIRKSVGGVDSSCFRQYIGKQFPINETVFIDRNEEQTLPVTTIFIIRGTKLAEIKCSCLKVGRTYTDIIDNESLSERLDFVEKLTPDSTRLNKLIGIFEQPHSDPDGLKAYFGIYDSGAAKIYRYQTGDEEIKFITDVLNRMGLDLEERKRIEDEVEFIRTIDDTYGEANRERNKIIEEKDKAIKEKDKKIAELKRLLCNKPAN